MVCHSVCDRDSTFLARFRVTFRKSVTLRLNLNGNFEAELCKHTDYLLTVFGRLPRLLCSWKSDDEEEREEEEEDSMAVCPTAADLESSELGSNARNAVGFIELYVIRHPFHLAAYRPISSQPFSAGCHGNRNWRPI